MLASQQCTHHGVTGQQHRQDRWRLASSTKSRKIEGKLTRRCRRHAARTTRNRCPVKCEQRKDNRDSCVRPIDHAQTKVDGSIFLGQQPWSSIAPPCPRDLTHSAGSSCAQGGMVRVQLQARPRRKAVQAICSPRRPSAGASAVDRASPSMLRPCW